MWITLALTLLKIAGTILTWGRERELISIGADREIAEMTHAIFLKTEAGKAIWDKVNALSDNEVDAALRELEPK